MYATVDARLKYNLLDKGSRVETSDTQESTEQSLGSETRDMNNYISSYVKRLSKLRLSYIRVAKGNGIHKPVTADEIVLSLARNFQFPGIAPEQIIFPGNQSELTSMGQFAVHVTLSQNTLLPGIGLCKEFEDRNIPPVPISVTVYQPKVQTAEEVEETAEAGSNKGKGKKKKGKTSATHTGFEDDDI